MKNKKEEILENSGVSSEKKSRRKFFKSKKLRSEIAFKKGGYNIIITALVLAVLVLFNWMISALSDKVNLEFNMSPDDTNTVSQENLDYIKKINKKVNVVVCSKEDNYSYYMTNYWCQNKNVTSETKYFSQTVTLVNEYAKANKKIDLKYIELNSSDFTALAQNRSITGLSPSYGDILVFNEDNNRYKKISFDDIYETYDETGYASVASAYGMDASYTISGNMIEKSLTGAISYVLSNETKKVALLTGHSEKDYTSVYQSLLKDNNYEVTVISDSLISSISSDFDAVAIAAPTTDFLEDELNAISEFLDNGSKLSKGLIYFAYAANPYLPNLNSYLSDWGITIEEGQTFAAVPYGNDPTTGYSLDTSGNILSNATCLTGQNVPLLAGESSDSSVKTISLLDAYNGAYKVPVGASADYSPKTEDYGQYSAAVQATKTGYVDDREVNSYITVFSSVEFINSEWVDYESISNKDVVLAVTDRASGVGETDIKFVTKTVKNESYKDKITNGSKSAVVFFFIFLIPICTLVLGIFIYIRRRNAQ